MRSIGDHADIVGETSYPHRSVRDAPAACQEHSAQPWRQIQYGSSRTSLGRSHLQRFAKGNCGLGGSK